MFSADELTERARTQNRGTIYDSMMARAPVSSGARRFSEGINQPICYFEFPDRKGNLMVLPRSSCMTSSLQIIADQLQTHKYNKRPDKN